MSLHSASNLSKLYMDFFWAHKPLSRAWGTQHGRTWAHKRKKKWNHIKWQCFIRQGRWSELNCKQQVVREHWEAVWVLEWAELMSASLLLCLPKVPWSSIIVKHTDCFPIYIGDVLTATGQKTLWRNDVIAHIWVFFSIYKILQHAAPNNLDGTLISTFLNFLHATLINSALASSYDTWD